jgi:hypothetical protein
MTSVASFFKRARVQTSVCVCRHRDTLIEKHSKHCIYTHKHHCVNTCIYTDTQTRNLFNNNAIAIK